MAQGCLKQQFLPGEGDNALVGYTPLDKSVPCQNGLYLVYIPPVH